MQYEEPRMASPARLLPAWASISCPWAISSRYANMLFKDHAFIRMAYRNMHPLDDRMWRAAQPTPGQVEDMAKAGIRTIINLRGRRESCGSYFFEVRNCARLGIELIDFPVRSRDAPRKDDIFAAVEMWRRIRYPAVMHCKAGADRVGLMSALYVLLVKREPLETAQQQLSWRYGHLREAKTGILDYFLETFAASGGRTAEDFLTWVEKDYDPVRFKATFRSKRWANLMMDQLLLRE